jgi:hypothetical protein
LLLFILMTPHINNAQRDNRNMNTMIKNLPNKVQLL